MLGTPKEKEERKEDILKGKGVKADDPVVILFYPFNC